MTEILIILGLIMLNGIFSMAEIALVSARKARLESQANKGDRRAKAALDLAEHAFVISSFGKTYSVTGWKMGYVLAPRELMAEFRKVHQFNVFVANGPLQHVLAEHMKNRDAYLSLNAFYQKKRDFFLAQLEGSRFKPLPSRGTFFQNLSYAAITDEKDSELAVRLTKEKGVASIPLSVFYHDGHCDRVLRFCFAESEEKLAKGPAILRSL